MKSLASTTVLATSPCFGGVPTPPNLTLLQKHRDTMGAVSEYKLVMHIIISLFTTSCQESGILVQKNRDRNGRCVAMLFTSIGVRDRFDSPEISQVLKMQSHSKSGPRHANPSSGCAAHGAKSQPDLLLGSTLLQLKTQVACLAASKSESSTGTKNL